MVDGGGGGWQCLIIMMLENGDGLGVTLAVLIPCQLFHIPFERVSSRWKDSCKNSMRPN